MKRVKNIVVLLTALIVALASVAIINTPVAAAVNDEGCCLQGVFYECNVINGLCECTDETVTRGPIMHCGCNGNGWCCHTINCCGPVWPMPNRQGLGRSNIISPFGYRILRENHHNGIDIAAFLNERVNAIGDGIVSVSGWFGGNAGYTVVINHPNGARTYYMHLNRLDVVRNAWVASGGQQIGGAGSSGNALNVHLHFEVRNRIGLRINPIEIWHWDDHRHNSMNQNPLFLFNHNRFVFVYNRNFDWACTNNAVNNMYLYDDAPCENIPQRREAFYHICGHIINLITHEEWVVFRDTMLSVVDEFEVMPLIMFIQHFGITREEVESAFARADTLLQETINFLQYKISRGLQMHDEFLIMLKGEPLYELPNLDIIFTFDNDAINLYYSK